jgi:asparagine synthase (glutamine-hydrolysing)
VLFIHPSEEKEDNLSAISGIVSQRGKYSGNSAKQVTRMLNHMAHRGPDNMIVRSLLDDRGAVGAIEINLEPSGKSFCTDFKESPHILFTGQLYNQQPEKKCDVALFKDYYEKYEEDGFSKLDGNFTAAIVRKDEEVILVRDHVGAIPIFYGSANDTFYFATEMKALKDHLQFGIEELPPGHIFSSRKGLKSFPPYSPAIPDMPDNINDAAKLLRQLLIEAVEKRMEGANAVSLSGGLDSSIVAAITKEYRQDMKLFTVSVESAPGPDLANAKLMAEFLGLKHFIYHITDDDIRRMMSDSIWYLESFDEDCISGILSNYFASKIVKAHSNAVLVGEGADELFGGYRMVLKNERVKDEEHREHLAKKLLDISYNTALRRLDRGWMANGVDYRIPYLDRKIVDFSQKVPMKWKIYGDKQIEKYILRLAFRDMLPEQIANREKLRFAMGTGMDNVMDAIVSAYVDSEELTRRPKAAYGLPFASFKELFYYDEFLQQFPPSYELQTVRWDPFK